MAEMEKKYNLEFYDEIVNENSEPVTLYRLRALRDIEGVVKAGELGGVVCGEDNLSHEGNCWVDYGSSVLDRATVEGNALVKNASVVRGDSLVTGESVITERSLVDGQAIVGGSAFVSESRVSDTAVMLDDSRLENRSHLSGTGILVKKMSLTDGNRLDAPAPDVLDSLELFSNEKISISNKIRFLLSGKLVKSKKLTDSLLSTFVYAFSENYSHINLKEEKKMSKELLIDEKNVNWEELEKMGVKKEMLEKKGELDKLLNFGKTDLLTINLPFQDTTLSVAARLNFVRLADGKFSLKLHPVQNVVSFKPFMGYEFTKEDKAALLHRGNLGKVVELTPPGGDKFKAIMSVDPQTKELVVMNVDRIKIPDELKGVKLSDDMKKELAEGKAVMIEGMTSKNGKTFSSLVQMNADKKGLEFILDDKLSYLQRFELAKEYDRLRKSGPFRSEVKEQERKFKVSEDYVAPEKVAGKELSEKQREALKKGRALYLTGMIDKKGQPFNCWVTAKNGASKGVDFHRTNPFDHSKAVHVSEENKVQVAVNSEGKSQEATKGIKEPLSSGQVSPKNKIQKEEVSKARKNNRKKGMQV